MATIITTSEKVNKALEILRGHDWFWFMADYNVSSERNAAYGNMKAFVRLVATIAEKEISQALRDLWCAKYDFEHATLFGSDAKAEKAFEEKKTELMAVIMPQQLAKAA